MTGVKYMASIPKERRLGLEWKMLIFKYNQHQVDTARQMAMDLGFDRFIQLYSNMRNTNSYGVGPMGV